MRCSLLQLHLVFSLLLFAHGNHHNFYNTTGVFRHHIHFCIERSAKAAICEELGIQVFIDDRFSVLQHLTQLQHLFLFQPSDEELALYKQNKSQLPIQVVGNWDDIIRKLA